MINKEQLKKICPYGNIEKLEQYSKCINSIAPKYGIDTLLRLRHFIAQIAHESGSFNYVQEIDSGEAYEGRKDLGNTFKGDGVRFKGRGLIQITGRSNYLFCSRALFGDDRLLRNPEILEQPQYAIESACWFWKVKKLNVMADANDIVSITRRINGGQNGLAERIAFYEKTKLYIKTL